MKSDDQLFGHHARPHERQDQRPFVRSMNFSSLLTRIFQLSFTRPIDERSTVILRRSSGHISQAGSTSSSADLSQQASSVVAHEQERSALRKSHRSRLPVAKYQSSASTVAVMASDTAASRSGNFDVQRVILPSRAGRRGCAAWNASARTNRRRSTERPCSIPSSLSIPPRSDAKEATAAISARGVQTSSTSALGR